ncbi:hypothetical protein BDV95DRAFT_217436 [Massariosphaeria phaeospora]|uniref:C2H2-type domain-containing protein n=1 Tax=Massariosphaeria phaeospora TaxID=100035 RepID=A0A7C8IEW8_9PLEO|nr:hypothetical protein BDV95DRAFT_217436 [Massariosphaeria phaeospora]
MAASTRAITPTHSGPFPPPNRSTTPASIAANAHAHALNAGAGATFGAHLTKSPRGLSPHMSPQPLTGMAAMADERRHREQEHSRHTSPNPALAVVHTLIGTNQTAMSRPRDAPPEPAQMSAPLEKIARSITIPDQVTTDAMQTSPVSLSSFGDDSATTAPTVTAMEATAGPMAMPMPGHNATPQHHHQHIAPNPSESPSSRAYTFPGPLADHDPRAPARQMSLPGYQNSEKSPSTKRHKCPYCSTDFTRHHNLKSHLLTHSQEKPYSCPTCQARFRRLHDLKRHTKLHTGERPHTCPKCGRKFARGDALARHNKGQGGCAGRRSSFGGDDDMDGKGEDMDGIIYNDGEGEDDEDGDPRASEPARKRQNTGNSTQAPSSISSLHYTANQANVFSQGGMTESPKPLSPGQQEQHRLGLREGSIPRPRSPSVSSKLYHSAFAHAANANKVSSPTGLPIQRGINDGPHLPSLPSMHASVGTQSQAAQGSRTNGPGMLPHQQMPAPNSHSQPGSLSSHGASSGASTRELMGPQNQELLGYIRELEMRLTTKTEEQENKITSLQTEVTMLRAQLAQYHSQSSIQAQQPPGP